MELDEQSQAESYGFKNLLLQWVNDFFFPVSEIQKSGQHKPQI